MKAKNKWGLYLVGAEYVTVSSGFILGERVRPKLEKQRQQPYVSYRPQRAAAPETCDRFLMSAWFNIRPGLDQGGLAYFADGPVGPGCGPDRQKGEELKVQRPPSCGISHSSIYLGGGGRGDAGMWRCVSHAFHCREASLAWCVIHVCLFTSACRWCFDQFLNSRC